MNPETNPTVEEIMSLFTNEGDGTMRRMPETIFQPCPICGKDYEFSIIVVGPFVCQQCHTDAITWAAKQALKEKTFVKEDNPFYQSSERS